MNQVVREENLPSCSRCGKDRLLTTADMPMKDAFGRPIRLELCKDCDAHKRPAAELIRFFSDGQVDADRGKEAADLMMEWTRAEMAAYGWYWSPKAEPSPN